ncbi:PKD domain-containing protein [Limnoglobus roseus]|uniref:PKD domain-containing protein n=1 Tax=Limnoglobus roseus TaxID=2598579 RepID=A0A5C1AEV1_9BACT|nr:PKD domain-containing protein [Limnoglobus roseus]QEL17065.1 PKD domain-containing protein [Limnoglobus roseus]
MADEKPARKNYIKIVFGSFMGLCTGGVMMYANALFDSVVKPPKPLANFSAGNADGLTANFQVTASGQSGWWDFGDGTALEPFDSEKTQVSHTYAKPGSYKVGLTVRNFLNEENDRSINVDVAAATASTAVGAVPNELPPAVKGWKVEAVGGTQAPATFHVTGELENADEVIWRLGNEKTEQLIAQSGPIDKYIRIDQPGQQHIVLTAISKTSKLPQVLVQAVDVQAQKSAIYTATLRVTDSGERVDTHTRTQLVSLMLRDKTGAATKSFTRVITASPASTIQSVEPGKMAKSVIKKESVKVEIAKDKLSATISGEWAVAGDALVREAGGSDVTLPLLVKEERVAQLSPTVSEVAGTLDSKQQIVLALPAARRGTKRSTAVDFSYRLPDGRRTPVANGQLDAAGNWVGKAKLGGKDTTIQARTVNGQVVITFQ